MKNVYWFREPQHVFGHFGVNRIDSETHIAIYRSWRGDKVEWSTDGVSDVNLDVVKKAAVLNLLSTTRRNIESLKTLEMQLQEWLAHAKNPEFLEAEREALGADSCLASKDFPNH